MAQNLSKGPLQVFPVGTVPELVVQLNEVLQKIRTELDQVQNLRGAQIDQYAASNASNLRTFNASTVTTPNLANVVATLIADLKTSYGIS